MKRSFLISICLVFVMTPAVIQAKEKVLLGNVNFAVKLDYITFTDDFFGQIGKGDHLILGISDTTPPVAKWSRILKINERVKAFGAIN